MCRCLYYHVCSYARDVDLLACCDIIYALWLYLMSLFCLCNLMGRIDAIILVFTVSILYTVAQHYIELFFSPEKFETRNFDMITPAKKEEVAVQWGYVK